VSVSPILRACLLAAAAVVGGAFALLGATFTGMADPGEYDSWARVFWLVAGAVIASPMWLPAVIPARLLPVGRWVRRAGAVALLLPFLFFSSIVAHNVDRWRNGGQPATLGFGLATSGACLVSMGLLLWPDFRAWRARRAPPSAP
jgi:hypothetical protein